MRSVLVYMAEVATAALLLIFDAWTFEPDASGIGVNQDKLLEIAKYVYVISILFSFLLLGIEIRKARRIMKSRDIAYAYTNSIAYKNYCLRSFNHYCFFNNVDNSRKLTDRWA